MRAQRCYTTEVRAVCVLVCLASGCTEPAARTAPSGPPSKTAVPACPRGKFAAELDAVLPPLEAPRSVALYPARPLDARIEPGCVVPFRNDPDERVIEAGRVLVRTILRPKGKSLLVGRGALSIGRRTLRLEAHDDGGTTTLALAVDGRHVKLRERNAEPFEADVSPEEETPLPLPLDALVAGLDRCDRDQRLTVSFDGNVVEARRGDLALWRSRFVDPTTSAIIDTSVGCSSDDTRLLWRSGAGEMLPMFVVASVRSARVLIIARQRPSVTDDVIDESPVPAAY